MRIRNLEVGAIFAAVLAIGAIAAPAAQAASALDVGAAPAWLTSEQIVQNKLVVTADDGSTLTTIKCATAQLETTTTTSSVTEATLSPYFGPVKTCLWGGVQATTKTNGCTFTLTNTATSFKWGMDIVCPAGKEIEIEETLATFTCTIYIAPQSGLEKITFSNVAGSSPAHVLATLEVTKIAVTAIGFACPANLTGKHTADLTGTQTMKAFKDEGGVQGAQVSLNAT